MEAMTLASVCDECPRTRRRGGARRFHRRLDRPLPSGRCFLDAGIVCAGIVTPSGCRALCPSSGSPCIGCLSSCSTSRFESRMLEELAALVGAPEDEAVATLRAAGLPEPEALLRDMALGRPAMRERLRRWSPPPRSHRRRRAAAAG